MNIFLDLTLLLCKLINCLKLVLDHCMHNFFFVQLLLSIIDFLSPTNTQVNSWLDGVFELLYNRKYDEKSLLVISFLDILIRPFDLELPTLTILRKVTQITFTSSLRHLAIFGHKIRLPNYTSINWCQEALLVFQHWCHSFSKFRFTSLDFKNIFGFLFFDAFCMTKLESYFLRFISWILNDEWSPVKRRALIASSLDDARSRGCCCCKIDAVRKFWEKWKMYARLWKFSLVGGKVGLSL